MGTKVTEFIDQYFSEYQTTIARDLKLNLKRLIDEGSLERETTLLLLIATAKSSAFPELLHAARAEGIELGLSSDVLLEAEDAAAIMAMNNVYYRYRHFIETHDPAAKDEYGAARLRMTGLGNPAMGKSRFELLALGVSAINGCEMCVTSHEVVLRQQHSISRDQLHDVARISAVVRGLAQLRRVES